MDVAPVSFAAALSPEDRARADFYALLARLYAAPPDAALLAAMAGAEKTAGDDGAPASELSRAWRNLSEASAAADAGTVAAEYAQLFVGVGRSEVSLHATSYGKSGDTNALLAIRTALAGLGLVRQAGVNLYEDHLAAVCETMRVLITGTGDGGAYTLEQQREFFERHIGPWSALCCNAISDNPVANYYRRVAQLTNIFLAIERDSFAIE